MKSRNDKVIENAFKRLALVKHTSIIDGMTALLRSAVTFALRRHKERHLPAHLDAGDSYGWALGHKGQCLAVEVTTGTIYSDRSVKEMLEAEVSNLSSTTNKYVGIVMAGMDPPQFYKIEHEEEILEDTMDLVEGDFDRYFHKV